MKIADMLTPQVTPPQARETIAKITRALTEKLGPDVRWVGDIMSSLKALAPADYDETIRNIDDYADRAEQAILDYQNTQVQAALAAAAAATNPAQTTLPIDDEPDPPTDPASDPDIEAKD